MKASDFALPKKTLSLKPETKDQPVSPLRPRIFKYIHDIKRLPDKEIDKIPCIYVEDTKDLAISGGSNIPISNALFPLILKIQPKTLLLDFENANISVEYFLKLLEKRCETFPYITELSIVEVFLTIDQLILIKKYFPHLKHLGDIKINNLKDVKAIAALFPDLTSIGIYRQPIESITDTCPTYNVINLDILAAVAKHFKLIQYINPSCTSWESGYLDIISRSKTLLSISDLPNYLDAPFECLLYLTENRDDLSSIEEIEINPRTVFTPDIIDWTQIDWTKFNALKSLEIQPSIKREDLYHFLSNNVEEIDKLPKTIREITINESSHSRSKSELEKEDFTDLMIGFIQYLPNLFNIIIHDFSGTYDKKRLAPFLSEKDIKVIFKSGTESSSEEK